MTETSARLSTDRSSAFALAAVCVGAAIGLSWSGFSPIGLALVAIAISLTTLALLNVIPPLPKSATTWILATGIACGFASLNLGQLFRADARARDLDVPFIALAVIAAVLIVAIFRLNSRTMRTYAFWFLLCIHLLMGAIVILAREPAIDVYIVQSYGCQTLAKGENPYAMTFPDTYGPNSPYYPPGIVKDGQVQCGYCYMPLSLLLEFPAYAIAGDPRYAHVLALALAALLIAYARPGERSFAAALLVLFLPDTFRRLQLAWIEPFVILALAATVFFACRQKLAAAAITLGLFLASKQYAPFTAPAALLLLPRPWRWKDALRFGSIALASGLAITLPFVLWNPYAFFYSLTALYAGSVRMDSISILPRLSEWLHFTPSLAIAVLATIPAMIVTLWKSPRTPEGFAASCALILLCLFAFSPIAFGNYYSLAASALCAAIAAKFN